jgi:hypothetical protein
MGHTLRRNCLLKHVIEGKLEGRIEVTGRRGRRTQSCYVMSFKFTFYSRTKIRSTSCPLEGFGLLQAEGPLLLPEESQ